MLMLGFGLGLIHALDADHIMAVSMLNAENRSILSVLLRCLNWALGHAGVLLLCGMLFFGLGLALPEWLQQFAEISVGLLLIAFGVIWAIRFRELTLKAHSHGDIVHVHWHEDTQRHTAQRNHKPVFVGMLHGVAGSAPVMALIPAVASGQFIQALVYLGVFSLGVTLSMLAFGLGFSRLQRFLCDRYNTLFCYSQQLLALISIVLGSVWLVQAI